MAFSNQTRARQSAVALLLAFIFLAGEGGLAEDSVYEKQIQPMLAKYCVGCHNADDKEGGLNLESFKALQKGGENGRVVLPGQPEASRLLRVLTGKAEPAMPPKDSEQPPKELIDALAKWLKNGAIGPKNQEPDRTILITPSIKAAGGPKPITSIAVSGDAKFLALARFKQIDIVNARTLAPVRSIKNLPGKVNRVQFSKDGKKLISASGISGLYGLASIWDVQTGKLVRSFQGHRDILFTAVLSNDEKKLATASYDQDIYVWEADTGKLLRKLQGHNDAVYDLDFSPDSTLLASASGDETVKVWHVETGKRFDTLGQPLAEQFVVRFSPDGNQVVAGGADNRIRVWRVTSRTKQQINPILYSRFAHEGPITQLEFTGDGKHLISVSEDRSMKLWETGKYAQVHSFKAQPDSVTGLALLADAPDVLVSRLDGSLDKYVIPAVNAQAVKSKSVSAAVTADSGNMKTIDEVEPNEDAKSMRVDIPVTIRGAIHADQGPTYDDFRFAVKEGEQWMIEVKASRMKSPLDSIIQILDTSGAPVPRVRLRAVRDSYFTFRGKDSSTIDDFRVHNWQEMELNEFLYANGEVVKLWLWPRGPDSGFKVYPGFGKRHTYFDTTPQSHALHAPCYIVSPLPPGTETIPNGLPVFDLNYENDDDSRREWGSDSRLTFTAPKSGEYCVRINDRRGFQGEKFRYELTIRPRRPSFEVRIDGFNSTILAGAGREFQLSAVRRDDFDGPVTVSFANLPAEFSVASPITIEQGQFKAFGTVMASAKAKTVSKEALQKIEITAEGVVNGKEVTQRVKPFTEIKIDAKPKYVPKIVYADGKPAKTMGNLEFVISPGETIAAKVIVERKGHKGRISLGNAEAGRNLPHGVIVDNIGLNGLMIVEGKSERTFFITAAKWLPEMTRTFHLKASEAGGPTTQSVTLKVRRKK